MAYTNQVTIRGNKYRWGISSAGRALEWHSRGQGFDPPILHDRKMPNPLISMDWAFFNAFSRFLVFVKAR